VVGGAKPNGNALLLTFGAREGCGAMEAERGNPSISLLKQGRGWCLRNKENPLQLVFGAREGDGAIKTTLLAFRMREGL
jgi:hypothetical protein